MGYAYEPKKTRWWYDDIIDWLLAHPGGNYKACAKALGRHPQYIGMICASDMFKKRLAERRASINERLEIAVVTKAKETSGKAMDILLERMTEQPEKMATHVVVNIMEKSLQAVYGPRALVGQQVPAQQVNIQTNVTVSREILSDARARIREVETRTIESSANEVSGDAPAEEVQPRQETEEDILDALMGGESPSDGGRAK